MFISASTQDISERIMFAFSTEPNFQVRLPIGDNQIFVIYIRDQLDSITQVNLSSINVRSDVDQINNLQNSFTQLILNGNQNTISQIIILLSQQFNQMNNEIINKAFYSN